MKEKPFSLDGLIHVDFKNLSKPTSSKSFNKVLLIVKEDEVGQKWTAFDRVKHYSKWDDFKADQFDTTGYVYKAVQRAFNQEKIGKLSIGRIFATDAEEEVLKDGKMVKADNPISVTLDALDDAMQGNFHLFTTSYAISDLDDMEVIAEWAEKTDHTFIKGLNDVSLCEIGTKESFAEKRKLNQYSRSSFGYHETIEEDAADFIFCMTWGATLDLSSPGKDEVEKTDGFNDFVGVNPTELNGTQINNLLYNRFWYVTNQNNKIFFRNVVSAREHAYSKDLDMFLGQDIFFTFVLTWLKVTQQEKIFEYHMSKGRKNMDNKAIASVRSIIKSNLTDASSYKLLLSNGDSIQINGVQVNVKNDVDSFSQADLTQSERQSGEMGRFEENIFIPNGIRKYKLGINYSY